MSTTANLALTYLEAAQAQKHVTVNDALRKLDAIVHLAVASATTAAQPGSPADGSVYLLPASPTGAAWGAMTAGRLAYYRDGAWQEITPKEGWLAYVKDTDRLLAFDGSSWTGPSLQNVALLGVNATADATNKLSVASSAVLFNNVGAGIQAKLNKNAAGDTASFLFQTGFSGRAEFGLIGDDNFTLKVSADGSAWTNAFLVDKTTGALTLQTAPAFAQAAQTRTNLGLGSAAVKNAPASGNATGADVVLASDTRLSDARAPLAHTQAWSTITGTPTTLAGYGIADAQGLNANLTAVAGLGTAANKLIYWTGAGTAALSDLTSVARTLLAQTTQALMRSAGLGLGAAAVEATGASGHTLPFLDAANTWSAVQTVNLGSAAASGVNVGGANAQDGVIRFAANPGQFRWMIFYSGAIATANQRWFVGASNTAEAGANAGSDFLFRARADDGTSLGDYVVLTRSNGQAAFFGNVVPTGDNAKSLGDASHRWSVVYAGTGAINTSDAREKSWRGSLPDGVKRAARRIAAGIGHYQWRTAIAAKGEDKARLHIGVTAQAVRDAFVAEGEDPDRWGLFCADPLFETVEVEETREARVEITEEYVELDLVHEDDRAVRRLVTRTRPVVEDVPLVEKGGAPALGPDGAPILVRRPKTRRVEETLRRSQARPALGADGRQIMRLGVRYDQLAMLCLAALAE